MQMSINGSAGASPLEGWQDNRQSGLRPATLNAGFSPKARRAVCPYVSRRCTNTSSGNSGQWQVEARLHARNPMTVWLMLPHPAYGESFSGDHHLHPACSGSSGAIFLHPFNPANWDDRRDPRGRQLLAWFAQSALAWDLAVYAAVLHMRHKGMLTPLP